MFCHSISRISIEVILASPIHDSHEAVHSHVRRNVLCCAEKSILLRICLQLSQHIVKRLQDIIHRLGRNLTVEYKTRVMHTKVPLDFASIPTAENWMCSAKTIFNESV